MEKLRIDKWLWAARFYKTRSLAVEDLLKGRVSVNDLSAKPAREVKVGDTISLRQNHVTRTLVVCGISSQRRKIDKASDKATGHDWDKRWSASVD